MQAESVGTMRTSTIPALAAYVGAKTPKHPVRWARGRRTIATNRSISSCGV